MMGNMTHVKSLVLGSNPFRGLRQDIIQVLVSLFIEMTYLKFLY